MRVCVVPTVGLIRDRFAAARAYGEARGWKIDPRYIYLDVGSGREARPGLEDLVRDVCREDAPFRNFVVDTHSRLFRDPIAWHQFDKMLLRHDVTEHEAYYALNGRSRFSLKVIACYNDDREEDFLITLPDDRIPMGGANAG